METIESPNKKYFVAEPDCSSSATPLLGPERSPQFDSYQEALDYIKNETPDDIGFSIWLTDTCDEAKQP